MDGEAEEGEERHFEEMGDEDVGGSNEGVISMNHRHVDPNNPDDTDVVVLDNRNDSDRNIHVDGGNSGSGDIHINIYGGNIHFDEIHGDISIGFIEGGDGSIHFNQGSGSNRMDIGTIDEMHVDGGAGPPDVIQG